MPLPRLQPFDLDSWRRTLYAGDQLDANQCRRLLAEVERLRSELASRRGEIAREAAGALEKRLGEVAAYNHGGCPSCKDAEARAFLARLKRIAGEG